MSPSILAAASLLLSFNNYGTPTASWPGAFDLRGGTRPRFQNAANLNQAKRRRAKNKQARRSRSRNRKP